MAKSSNRQAYVDDMAESETPPLTQGHTIIE
jgi:hypothetical protein